MRDIYLMNKLTGELQPSEKVIREWYATHAYDTRWCDEWEETCVKVEDTFVYPDFSGVFAE